MPNFNINSGQVLGFITQGSLLDGLEVRLYPDVSGVWSKPVGNAVKEDGNIKICGLPHLKRKSQLFLTFLAPCCAKSLSLAL